MLLNYKTHDNLIYVYVDNFFFLLFSYTFYVFTFNYVVNVTIRYYINHTFKSIPEMYMCITNV